jgi:uncharacterized protein (TIGR02246 family)
MRLRLVATALGMAGLSVQAAAQNVQTKPAAPTAAPAVADADEAAIRKLSASLAATFNAGKPADVSALFVEDGEIVDEAGNLYRGKPTIAEAMGRYFESFPGAKLTYSTGSIRKIGADVAIEDGVSVIETSDAAATNQYTTVYVKRDGKWQIASLRQVEDTAPPTPHEKLEPLAWLVGSWVDEGAASSLAMNCRWTEDENFLLVDYAVSSEGNVVLKSTQRIGWDPRTRQVKSWIFDSDGGHGEGICTPVEGQWVIKTSGVTPEGVTGTATIIMTPESADRFTWETVDRITGESVEPNTKVTVVRKAPAPK